MKISELNKLSNVERSAIIPVSLNGETLGVTVGTVIDATDVSVVRFESIVDATGNYTMHDSFSGMINERVVFDKALKNNVVGSQPYERNYIIHFFVRL